MFILTLLSAALILSCAKARRVVDVLNVDDGNWDPFLFVPKDLDESPNYDITRWVRQLHLQQCAFVEIGEGFCALFVELRSIPSESKVLDSSGVGEFFLGICPCLTLHTWDLCSPELLTLRKSDCTFNEATPYSNTTARVHRRLCDVTSLVEYAPRCNCSISLAGQRLYETKGFPTCFLNPLPESLCSPRGVCGIARCTVTTIKGIHAPQCSPNCHQRQPFCEEIGPSTSIPAEINSLWSRWSSPKCNNTCGRGYLVAVATCQDQRKSGHRLYRAGIVLVRQRSYEEVPSNSLTMTKGVNFSSCPDSSGKCYCEVNTVDGIMKSARFTEPCISTEGCIPSSAGTFTSEGESDPGNSIDFDTQAYENDERERFEDTGLYPAESARTGHRRLLETRGDQEDEEQEVEERYGFRENRLANKNIEDKHGYRSVPRSRLGDGEVEENDQDKEEDDDDEDGNDEEDNPGDDEDDEDEDQEEEEEEENRDETIGLRGSAKGRRSPRKRTREAYPGIDYTRIAYQGKPEVNEPESQGSMEMRSVEEDCEDDSTEPAQYYDYDRGERASADLRFGLALVALNILL